MSPILLLWSLTDECSDETICICALEKIALMDFKQDNYSTMGGEGECRVGKVRASTTSPMPDNKGFKLQ